MKIRAAQPSDFDDILNVINDAAETYRGVIPSDCWNDPYMSAKDLKSEIEKNVVFWVIEDQRCLRSVMGIQDKDDVALVRHAYTATESQRRGFGTRLLHHMESLTAKPMLIGTWAAANWAISFYRNNKYRVVSDLEKDWLLREYWTIPDRQLETSVVLADRRWNGDKK
jgi:N-acetylglutamate synthase-like GNAT family acetyltransferase